MAVLSMLLGPGSVVQAESLETIDVGRGDGPLFTPDTVAEDEPKPLILWLHGGTSKHSWNRLAFWRSAGAILAGTMPLYEHGPGISLR